MVFLKEISIKNYRGIKELSFKPKSINLIVGPNNTGKSAILEGIGLAISSSRDFMDVLMEHELLVKSSNLIEYLLESREYPPQYLIRVGANSSEITSQIGRTHYTVKMSYFSTGLPEDDFLKDQIITTLLEEIKEGISLTKGFLDFLHRFSRVKTKNVMSDELQLRQKALSYLVAQPKLLIQVFKNDTLYRAYIYFPEFQEIEDPELESVLMFFPDGLFNIYDSTSYSRKKPIVLDFSRVGIASEIEELYDILLEKGLIKGIKEFLKNQIPYFEDMDRTEKEIYVYLSNFDKPMPLSTMGDGFLTLLKVSFLISLAKGGILVIEEPEISLHPGFLRIIAEEIIKNMDTTQFFISTHSLDFVKFVLDNAELNNKLNQVNIIRLHRKRVGTSIKAQLIDGKYAKELLDKIGKDLRGPG